MKRISFFLSAALFFCYLLIGCYKPATEDAKPIEDVAQRIASNKPASYNAKDVDPQESEYVRHEMALGLISFKAGLADAYKQSSSYGTFKEYLFGDSTHVLSDTADLLLVGTYKLFVHGIADDDIEAKYDGFEMAKACLFLEANPSSDGAEYFNLTASQIQRALHPCKWYQIGCHVDHVLAWFASHKDGLAGLASLVGIIVGIASLF